jgi:hypothetical protein
MPSGELCSCTPAGGVDLPRWNASHSRRWNHLRTTLRREYPDLEFFRGVEVQQRGALHDHALVWSPVPLRKSVVRDLAMRAGFGHALDLAPITSAKQAAYYVSKYVTKATDLRADVPWWGDVIDFDTGEVTEGIVDGRYRTWSMSRRWGLRMADVRAEALAFVRAQQAAQLDEFMALLVTELGARPLLDHGSPSPPP